MNTQGIFSLQNREPVDVLLINMPFGPLDKPSIGLGLLQAAAKQAGLSCATLNFTMLFAQHIGADPYSEIAISHYAVTEQIGEWAFSVGLYPAETSAPYLEEVLFSRVRAFSSDEDKANLEILVKCLLNVREQVIDFLDECLAIVLKYHPKLVGFTSTFQQQMAALALAKRVKEQLPSSTVMFGGANVEGVMGVELVRQFPFVDAVVSGEADLIFSEVATRVIAGTSIGDIQGVYNRHNIDFIGLNGVVPNAPSVQDMDALPFPDYGDFVAQQRELALNFVPSILFETSRGCWWGAKSHCTFCGLNGLTMRFRSKSPDRALQEILHLQASYPSSQMAAVDNILDMKYFSTFVPSLAAQNLDLALFYEVKANLKKEHLRLLRDAKITTIQPGVESFSTNILDLMKKGIKGIQNVQLLKWCEEFDIHPAWNIIWGFPGEPPDEYDAMANMVPLLTHMRPPAAWGPVRLDRFSPLFGELKGVRNVRPYPCYAYLYPDVPAQSLPNLAYYFVFEYEDERNVFEYTRGLVRTLKDWVQQYIRSQLHLLHHGGDTVIWDLRPIALTMIVRLTGLERALYLACDTIQGLNALTKVAEPFIGSVSRNEMHVIMQSFVDAKLMIEEDDTYLSLAVWVREDSPTMVNYRQTLDVLRVAQQMPSYYRVALSDKAAHLTTIPHRKEVIA